MNETIRLTRQHVRDELKQFLIFKWYCPEFLSKEFLNHMMEQLPFIEDEIEFPSLAEMTFRFNELIEEAMEWQQHEWRKHPITSSTTRICDASLDDDLPF